MAGFYLNKSTLVSVLKQEFNEAFGAKLRVYVGRSQVDDGATLSEVGLSNEGTFECRASLTVGRFIERMQNEFGLKVKVYTCDEWVAVLDGLTLESAGKVKKNAVKADMDSLLAYQRDDATLVNDTIKQPVESANDNIDDEIEDDYEWCENVDYEGVEYSVCAGCASATFIMDDEIKHLVIPEKIQDENGQSFIVTEFDITDLESVTHITLPATIEHIYGCAFERDTNITVDFLGEPSVCLENGTFYSKDKKILMNTKLANVGEKYTVEEGVEEIAIEAFSDCAMLRELNIPSTIKVINPAFQECESLEIVNVYTTADNVVLQNLDRNDEEVDIFPPDVRVNYIESKPSIPVESNNTDKRGVYKKFAKSSTDKMIAGVCGGIAERLGINSIIVRIVALLTFGFYFWGYIILCLVMPKSQAARGEY